MLVTIVDALAGKPGIGEEVTVQGWVRNRRDSKAGLSFLNVHDGSCFNPIQAVADNNLENYNSEVVKLTAGCAVKVTGTLVESQGKGQDYEIQATSVEVMGWVDDPDTYPMQPKRHSMEFLRDNAHLRPRTNITGAVTRVRNSIAQAIHRYFHEHGFNWIHTPIITASDAEGAGEMFRVSTLDMMNLPKDDKGNIDYSKDFFGSESFLTVSGQLNVEAYAMAMSKVYTFGPTFRAENSHTSRHLAEFWMVEPEIAFADLNDNADLAEDMMRYVFEAVLNERQDDMEFFQQRVDSECINRLRNVIDNKFERMDYTDVIEILKKSDKKFEYPVEWGIDLQSEHERYIAEEHVGRPTVVMNYPKDIKAFYMRLNDDEKTVAAMDVLAPGIGEIIGGAQREERLDVLDKRIAEMGLPAEHYWWYRDLRRYGTVPHAGFGLGFDRCVSYVTGVSNIRDVIPFPRVPNNVKF
ncbi:asparagine--tRNA ligase [Kangiella spongicola]|jgi:asparaginyl-tRNA synthetase|uniref:Asparagine--tRNA ligase n=1 Tax=Kangiella spongicola TaxID=796379 RepID=A0A318D0S5_9GAMM|nr:asparagine--tRNA ligase [Kangiella spongicola]MBV36321.1 asparagine--tRNA ligase [Rickettsiales bacterium]PXF62591.1 asparagine--tRNA ligase [Kangiella spongicola]